MQIVGQAKRVVIYIGESDKWGRKPLYIAILEMLKAEGCAGATVSRALSGFGAHSHIKTASLVALSADLPLMLEWVDNPARIEQVMPKLREMVKEGLITAENVDVLFYSHRDLHHLSAFVPVQDIMSRQVYTVKPNTLLVKAVELLLDRVYKILPVVDDNGHVTGIFTDGDLLSKINLVATDAHQHFSRDELDAELQHLRNLDKTVQDVMTPNPVTVLIGTTVPQVVELMLTHNIKRLPVVDNDNNLVGVVSRVDVLRAFAQPLTTETPRESLDHGQHLRVKNIMMTNIPTVHMNAPLQDVVSMLVSNIQRRVVVVDDDHSVVGIITDGDLIKRATPTERSGLIHSLTHRLPLGTGDDYGLGNRTVGQVMTTPVITVTPETPLIEALQMMLTDHIKRLPVVDEQERLVGLVGRGGILQAMGQQ